MLKCAPCIHDRLVGKDIKNIGLTLRTSKDAVTVMDGAALCPDHLGQRLLQRQAAWERQIAAHAAARAAARAGTPDQAPAAETPVSKPVAT